MGEILQKIFAVILIVILMFFFPLLDSFERMDDLSYMSVYAATVKFVDGVRNNGSITPAMYNEFIQVLNATGNTYSVEMVHRKSLVYPKKDNYALNEAHESIVLYDEFYEEEILAKMKVLTLVEEDGELKLVSNTNTSQQVEYNDFAVGDYFYVSVKNISTTPATVIKRTIYAYNMDDLVIIVPYGGMIRNDVLENQ